MLDPILGDLAADVLGVALGVKLAGMNANNYKFILIFFLELGQIGQDVMAIDAAKGPEIEQDNLAAQLGERDRAGVDPGNAAAEARLHSLGKRHSFYWRTPPQFKIQGTPVPAGRHRALDNEAADDGGNGEQGRRPAGEIA